MTNKITRLPEYVIESIAAGEVIERPADVLKELLENSIDAGATRIEIEIGDGWKEGGGYIIVRDDGTGISEEDMSLIFERYATSKIVDENDLYNLNTLGFRGEALSSIQAVSHIIIQSRTPDMEWGYQIEGEFGEISDIEETGVPPGTEVEVKYLFLEKPVRRKFLKSDMAEFRECYKTFIKIVLFHPEIHFILKHNDKNVLNLARDDYPSKERVRAILGEDIAQAMIEVEHSVGQRRVSGFISNPSISKGNSTNMFFALNRRPFTDRNFIYHILNIYGGLLPSKKYPVLLLNLKLDPETYDVNVHPRKEEIRFDNRKVVDELISTAIKKNLLKQSSDISGTEDTKFRREHMDKFRTNDLSHLSNLLRDRGEVSTEGGLQLRGKKVLEEVGVRYLGQLWKTYLIVEDGDELSLIDQHAVMERKLFDSMIDILNTGNSDAITQMLLIPRPVFCPEVKKDAYREFRDLLEDLGYNIEAFGKDTILLRGIPQLLPPHNEVELLSDVLDEVSDEEILKRYNSEIECITASIACHKSIRAKENISREGALELIQYLYSLPEDERRCPHGRPLTITLTRKEVERQFGRF
jgi:DNA mismatch repair protein MutL